MPDYKITITKTAQKQLDEIPDRDAVKVIATIRGLAHNPRPSGYRKLKGREGFRIRKGNYRILGIDPDCKCHCNRSPEKHLQINHSI